MRSRLLGLWLVVALGLFGVRSVEAAVPWFALGPYGGDARAIAQDPSDSKHLFLGTANGWVYESRDGGRDWTRLAQIAKRNDLVIDHMLIDPANPKHLMVGTWVIDRPEGGLYVSIDGGRNWYDQAQMRGQSIRAMARSEKDPNVIVAGTLKGVFRSKDGGTHWNLISPPGSTEIHEVESIAIDPEDTDVIYAGTWHLPWKTSDGGEHWENIKNGVIDDSDVFSIIIDPEHPKTVYASACSGIYKSTDAGAQFRKINGIPSTARRTRKLAQDPSALKTVYAGTTEGLYRTTDAGSQWGLLTGKDVIINDVWVDPKDSNHILLATDRGGVLASYDNGEKFESSNTGFSARQVVSYAANGRTGEMFVGVVNDKTTGGVFASADGGLQWTQRADGLGGRDVFSLVVSPDGRVLAGTNHGIFRLEDAAWTESSKLMPAQAAEAKKADAKDEGKTEAKPAAKDGAAAEKAGKVVKPAVKASAKPAAKTSTPAGKRKAAPVAPKRKSATRAHKADAAFYFYARPLRPAQKKKTVPAKKPVVKKVVAPVKPAPPAEPTRMDAGIYALDRLDDAIFAGTANGLVRSDDNGDSWVPVSQLAMPEVRFLGSLKKMVLAGTLKRLALSVDAGKTWDTVALPKDLTQIGAVGVDELNNLWVGGREGVYYSTDLGENWKTLKNLFITQADNIYFDAAGHRVLVTSSTSPFAFSVSLPEYKVRYWETGWNLRFVRPVGDHLVGASLFDGMVVQPRMVDSKF